MINYDYIQKAIIAQVETDLQGKGYVLEQHTIEQMVDFPHQFVDLQNRKVILANEDLFVMGDNKKTLILQSPDNILVTSPAEFISLGIAKYQVFSGFLDIHTLCGVNNNFIPFPLILIELIAKIK